MKNALHDPYNISSCKRDQSVDLDIRNYLENNLVRVCFIVRLKGTSIALLTRVILFDWIGRDLRNNDEITKMPLKINEGERRVHVCNNGN